MTTWQTMTFTLGNAATPKGWADVLATYAAEGWRFVQAVPVPGGFLLIWQRPREAATR